MEITLIKESSAAGLLLHMPQADTVKHGQTTSLTNEVFWTSHFQKQSPHCNTGKEPQRASW